MIFPSITRDKKGNVLSKEEVILYRWKDPENKALVTPVMNTLKINTDPPSVEEIKS